MVIAWLITLFLLKIWAPLCAFLCSVFICRVLLLVIIRVLKKFQANVIYNDFLKVGINVFDK